MVAQQQKQSGKKKQPKKRRGLMIVGVSIAVLIVGLTLADYISTLHYQQTLLKEDITFARIETFVDLAKLRLEQELPEGKWEIEKYCREPSSKGDIDAYDYGCSYYATNSVGLYDVEKLKSVGSILSDSTDIYTYRNREGFSYDVSERIGLRGYCGFSASRDDDKSAYYASVSCGANGFTLRYPLEQGP